MTDTNRRPESWLAAWLRRLNRRRLAWRRQRRQREVDRAWFAQDDPLRPDVQAALRARLAACAALPRLAVVALPGAAPSPQGVAWPFGTAGAMDVPWDRIDVAHGAGDPREAMMALDAAVAASRADAVLVVPPGFELAPHAVLMFMEAMSRFARCKLMYADDDSIDARGRRFGACLRPDWNAELLRSINYLDGPVCIARQAWPAGSSDDPQTLDAAWWSRLLHVSEMAAADQIVHIPHVLAHRVAPWPGTWPATMPPASAVAVAAVQAHLDRAGMAATAQASPLGGVHVRYRVSPSPPRVSLIIPTRNGLALIEQCVGSVLARTTYPSFEMLIVDNGSDETATLEFLRRVTADARVRVVRDERPFNYSALNNAAARQCRGELLALVNNDIEVLSPDWLDEMVGQALRPEVGAVGARLWFPDGRLQHAGVVLGLGGVAGHPHRMLARGAPGYLGRAQLTQEFSAVTAACMVLRRAVFDEVGGLDEQHLAVDFNDIDLCLRIRQAGYRIVWTPHAELVHHESASRGQRRLAEQQARFEREAATLQQRWAAQLHRDPHYNPNATLGGRDLEFSLTAQPRVSLTRPWFESTA